MVHQIKLTILLIGLISNLNQIVSHVIVDQDTDNNTNNNNSKQLRELNYYDGVKEPRGWVETATNALAGPAGQMVVHFAKEMISRQAGNSQILSFNLTNLLILVFLKALIFTAGLIGAGNWSHYARGRFADSPILIQPHEPPLFIGFLASEGSGDYSCLHNAACVSPGTATEYIKASKALLKGMEIFDTTLSYNGHYRNAIHSTERAVMDGLSGAPCDLIYRCRV